MSNQNIKEIKDSDGNVKFRIAKIGVFGTSPTPSIEDLVKRIESLEKQLADMQKATSCGGDHMRLILNHMTKMNDAFSTKS